MLCIEHIQLHQDGYLLGVKITCRDPETQDASQYGDWVTIGQCVTGTREQTSYDTTPEQDWRRFVERVDALIDKIHHV